MLLRRARLAATALGLSLLLGATVSVRADLPRYVREPDPSFAWTQQENHTSLGIRTRELLLTSQTWRDIKWQHRLTVYEPTGAELPDVALLFISGGKNTNLEARDDHLIGTILARLCGGRVAVLRQVPNQPLLGGKSEDDLIAETFVHYIESGEESWPLLQPMVKSAVAAMDALQQQAEKDGRPLRSFVVTGASKRGWTTWLTAAVDRRVAAIAPMVIPTLNMKPQTEHQLEVWGAFSEQIEDYVRRGLLQQFDTPRGRSLWRMVDPYTYLDRIRVPVLQINGTNDRYWTLDSMNLYWDDIQAPKAVVYLPNAGHGMQENRDYALNGVRALFRLVVAGQPLPEISWTHTEGDAGNSLVLSVQATPEPRSARLWVAHSETKDFRDARWTSRPMGKDKHWVGQVERPETGSVALFGDLTFEVEGLEYHLSTQVRQVDPAPAE